MNVDLRRCWLLAGVLLVTGCMTKSQAVAMRTGQGEAMPVIEIQPGVAERLALMDEYRLHDETRKHMTRRPHVTVEELPLDEPLQPEPAPAPPLAQEEDASTSSAEPAPPTASLASRDGAASH